MVEFPRTRKSVPIQQTYPCLLETRRVVTNAPLLKTTIIKKTVCDRVWFPNLKKPKFAELPESSAAFGGTAVKPTYFLRVQ